MLQTFIISQLDRFKSKNPKFVIFDRVFQTGRDIVVMYTPPIRRSVINVHIPILLLCLKQSPEAVAIIFILIWVAATAAAVSLPR